MELSKDKIREYLNRILKSRVRLLQDHGFYGLILSHLIISLDDSIDTAATDAKRIYFSPKFLDELTDSELDFVLMHELLHVVLKHVERTDLRDNYIFNIACDIVVNSNILYSSNMNLSSITLRKYGVAMHLTPDLNEGYKYSAEEVYEMILKDLVNKSKNKKGPKKVVYSYSGDEKNEKEDIEGSSNEREIDDYSEQLDSESIYSKATVDDHSKWNDELIDSSEIDKILKDAYDSTKSQPGNVPYSVERIIKDKYLTKTNWKEILNEYIQYDDRDYSFNPPDRRFQDDFFMPDFNLNDNGKIDNLLFFIDTSGSISKKDLHVAYNEIRTALYMFDDKLKGELGFFDQKVYEPKPFEKIDDLDSIIPKGGGGTSFYQVFKYVSLNYDANSIKCLIILTDGEDRFPNYKMLKGIPIIWLINNDRVTPPYGRIVRMKS